MPAHVPLVWCEWKILCATFVYDIIVWDIAMKKMTEEKHEIEQLFFFNPFSPDHLLGKWLKYVIFSLPTTEQGALIKEISADLLKMGQYGLQKLKID